MEVYNHIHLCNYTNILWEIEIDGSKIMINSVNLNERNVKHLRKVQTATQRIRIYISNVDAH